MIRVSTEQRAALDIVQRSRRFVECLCSNYEGSLTLVKRTPNGAWRPAHAATWDQQFTLSGWLKEVLQALSPGPKRKMVDILVFHGTKWEEMVKVVSVYTPVWIVYDKYGLWSNKDPALTCGAERSAPPAVADEDLDLALKYYEVKNAKREELVEEARAEAGEIKFGVTTSLRQTWMAEQRLDPALSPMFAAKQLDQGYRRGTDGLLERHVKRPSPLGAIWVPIVPAGNATAILTWKQWVFLQCHVGVLGAHRNAEKTLSLIL